MRHRHEAVQSLLAAPTLTPTLTLTLALALALALALTLTLTLTLTRRACTALAASQV